MSKGKYHILDVKPVGSKGLKIQRPDPIDEGINTNIPYTYCIATAINNIFLQSYIDHRLTLHVCAGFLHNSLIQSSGYHKASQCEFRNM